MCTALLGILLIASTICAGFFIPEEEQSTGIKHSFGKHRVLLSCKGDVGYLATQMKRRHCDRH